MGAGIAHVGGERKAAFYMSLSSRQNIAGKSRRLYVDQHGSVPELIQCSAQTGKLKVISP